MPARSYAVAAALLAAAPTAYAGSKMQIINSCEHPVYIFKRVGTGAGGYSGPKITKGPGETLEEPCQGEAVNYLIHSQNTDVPCPGAECTQFEYTETDMMYYDVSNIDGYPFSEKGLSLTTDDSNCPDVSCPPGNPVCSDAYNNPTDVRTLTCATGCTLTLDLCNSNTKGSHTPSDSSSSTGGDTGSSGGDYEAPAEDYTQPQQYEQPEQQPDYGQPLQQGPDGNVYAQAVPANDPAPQGQQDVVTTLVTKYDYVYQKRSEATAAPQPEKRHAHAHYHAHAGHHA